MTALPPHTPSTAPDWGTHLRLLLMAVIWGASWPWGQVVAQTMPPLTATTLRFGVASTVLLLWLWRRNRWQSLRALTLRQWLGLTAAAATGMLAYSAFFMYALQHVPSGRASVVIALNPVLTLVLAAWLLGERLNARIALGMALAIMGALTVITRGQPWLILQGSLGTGEWLLLGCVGSWVAYTLIGRIMLTGIDAFTATSATVTLGCAMCALASLCAEGAEAWAQLPDAPLRGWLCVLALGMLATALAYMWYFRGIKALGAGNAAAYITLVPVFGVTLSSLWLSQPLHLSLLIGAALAVGGMAVMHWGRLK